jgi:hypothetical protein
MFLPLTIHNIRWASSADILLIGEVQIWLVAVHNVLVRKKIVLACGSHLSQ